MWLVPVALIGGCLLLLIRALLRQNQEQILNDWQSALAPWGTELYQELEQRIEAESRMADYLYNNALRAKSAGLLDEAIRLLDVGAGVVARTSPDMMSLLRGMGAAPRIAASVSPVQPLQARDFRLHQLSGIALVAGILHRFVASPRERLRLRAYVLRQGIGVATRFLRSTTERIRLRREHAEAEWDQIAAARRDLKTLSRESLIAFRSLLLSLAVEP